VRSHAACTYSAVVSRIEAQLNALVSNVGTIIPPQKSHSSDAATHQECGVGMELEKNDCQWYVAGVRPGGPAATAGVRAGDLLCAVDWKHVKVRTFFPRFPVLLRNLLCAWYVYTCMSALDDFPLSTSLRPPAGPSVRLHRNAAGLQLKTTAVLQDYN